MKRELLNELLAARAAKRPVVLATLLSSGVQAIYAPDGGGNSFPFSDDVVAAAEKALLEDRSRSVESNEGQVFIQVFNSPLRMIVVGAVHITQVLVPMARLTGYDVTVVDPRRAFANDERFPSVRVMTDWPDDAMKTLAPNRRTAVVTLTHDPKLDDPALHVALRSQAFYIGCLGSRKTHAARLKRLESAGFSDTDFARMHGPVGLALGATSPAEIAVSIMAQITRALRQGAPSEIAA